MSKDWVISHCRKPGNEALCIVNREYIEDSFNLEGIESYIDDYEYAMDIILGNKIPTRLLKYKRENFMKSAELLYGLIHARYIVTELGLNKMREKFTMGKFEKCPRIYCNGQITLPAGQDDLPNKSKCKIYCPRCKELYDPRGKIKLLDSAYIGSTFAHLLLLTNQDLVPPNEEKKYVPKIYGFKLRHH